MKIKHALAEYLLEIEVRKYTPKTIRSYRNNLNLFVRYLDEEAEVFDTEDLTLAAVRKFSAYMVGRGKKGRYVNGLLKTAKSFIQYCYEEGYGGFNTKKNFKSDVGRVLIESPIHHDAPCIVVKTQRILHDFSSFTQATFL